MNLTQFRTSIEHAKRQGALPSSVIGEGRVIPGLYGDVSLTYADYVASGRALQQVETFISQEVLPFYANSHTETSYCGGFVTQLREAARAEIASLTGCGPEHAVIFAGNGATAGINRLVTLFGVAQAKNPIVLIGPYEHHSNILPWRESGAQVIEINEAAEGGPDLNDLQAQLQRHKDSDLVIGSFSAASNVTGILTDTAAVTQILKDHGALSVWDYAGGGPYVPINVDDCDAIVVSAHKFPGGPGASGILIVNTQAVATNRPSWPGGGTVTYVSAWGHDYIPSLIAQEEAGTPNVLADIRAGLAFIVKDVIGQEWIESREHHAFEKAMTAWKNIPNLQLLGNLEATRLPIFSFNIEENGRALSPALMTMMLSDVYGVQARGGCSCAGPYGHRLLNIGRDVSEQMRGQIRDGIMMEKPGWVRLNFSYMMAEPAIDRVIHAVADLCETWESHMVHYEIDANSGQPRRKLQAA